MKHLVAKLQEMHANRLASKLDKQRGATMLEYAILIGIVVAVAAIFQDKLIGADGFFTKMFDNLDELNPPAAPGAGG